ncbi:MAG: FCD domain-containing protein [Paracoccaceae bacterium]
MRGKVQGDGQLQADQAFQALRSSLRAGQLRAGQFLSMPGLVEVLDFPIAAMRDAVKRAEVAGLVQVMPKRGVLVMNAGPVETRNCMDARAALDAEGARRRIAANRLDGLAALIASHTAVLDEARQSPTPSLSPRAMQTDLSLHDYLAQGLDNPYLTDAYSENRDRIAIVQASRPFLADRIVSAMEEHMAILAALQAGDAAACGAAIWRHHEQTLRWWGVTQPTTA